MKHLKLTHLDSRSDMFYEIEITGEGHFRANGYVDRIGSNPICFEQLKEIPEPARSNIEKKILDARRAQKKALREAI